MEYVSWFESFPFKFTSEVTSGGNRLPLDKAERVIQGSRG